MQATTRTTIAALSWTNTRDEAALLRLGTALAGFPLTGVHQTADCESCHIGGVFRGIPTRCNACHTRSSLTSAEGKNLGHMPTADTCDHCHTTNSWSSASFDHANITGSCASCHNGTTATGKHAQHIQTNNLCEDCHRTTAWSPVTQINHNDVLGSCSFCHNGTQATVKPGNHFGTSLECGYCHQTTNWTTLIFRHSSPSYPGDHSGNPPCSACHLSNSQVVNWPSPGYQPDCAGCHASDYRPNKHENWSVRQNRNCAGTCHKNSPEHNVRDRNWD